jgi:hypothetical protein
MTIPRLVLLATTAAAIALPAAPASADPIIDCDGGWPTGAVRCELAETENEIREDPPLLCRPTSMTGPLECAVERKVKELLAAIPPQ